MFIYFCSLFVPFWGQNVPFLALNVPFWVLSCMHASIFTPKRCYRTCSFAWSFCMHASNSTAFVPFWSQMFLECPWLVTEKRNNEILYSQGLQSLCSFVPLSFNKRLYINIYITHIIAFLKKPGTKEHFRNQEVRRIECTSCYVCDSAQGN